MFSCSVLNLEINYWTVNNNQQKTDRRQLNMWWVPARSETTDKNKIKSHTISSIQISKIYSFQTAYWKKNILSWNCNCYKDGISFGIYIYMEWLASAYRPQFLKYNYGNEFRNKNLKYHSKYTEIVQIN